jgi:hypothetical protein
MHSRDAHDVVTRVDLGFLLRTVTGDAIRQLCVLLDAFTQVGVLYTFKLGPTFDSHRGEPFFMSRLSFQRPFVRFSLLRLEVCSHKRQGQLL